MRFFHQYKSRLGIGFLEGMLKLNSQFLIGASIQNYA